MVHSSRLILCLSLTTSILATGCLSEQPSGPLNVGTPVAVETKPAEPELPPDSQADIDALKAANAWLTTDPKTGRVTRVELSSSATDDQLKHLAGLPALERLQCNSRGITDAGLVHLKGHPSLWYIDFEQTSITDAGASA